MEGVNKPDQDLTISSFAKNKLLCVDQLQKMNNETENLLSEELKEFMDKKEVKPMRSQLERTLIDRKQKRNRWGEKMRKAGNEVIENHTFEDGVTVHYYLPEK